MISFLVSSSQTIGGNAAYNFLKLPATPILSALGGVNTSYRTSEVGLAANNPSLLHPGLSSQLNLSFNAFLSGSRNYSLTGAHYVPAVSTTFGGHISYMDYGKIAATDAGGNVGGEFRPVDFVLQVSAARHYLQKWHYGGTLKFIHSSYQQYRSSAIAIDFGIMYVDSPRNLTASVLTRNMGVQLKTFGGEKEDLPFDLQFGISKKLSNAPFGFSLTAHHLHRFNFSYNDTAFNNENGFSSPEAITGFFDHFVLATHIYIGSHLEGTIGYNALRRNELSIPGGSNGLTGFSAGLRVKFDKLQILYARSAYQRGVSYNQIGVTVSMNKLTGLGK